MASDVLNLEAPVSRKVDQRAGKYLTFGLGDEEFAIQVLRVREIIGLQQITAVPQTPGYVKGVVNLRGKVIPVVDLRLKFGMPEQKYTPNTCMIVAQVQRDGVALPTAVVVDDVFEVITVQPPDIEETPDFGRRVSTCCLLGMANIRGRVKILLDIDMVMKAEETPGVTGGPGSDASKR